MHHCAWVFILLNQHYRSLTNAIWLPCMCRAYMRGDIKAPLNLTSDFELTFALWTQKHLAHLSISLWCFSTIKPHQQFSTEEWMPFAICYWTCHTHGSFYCNTSLCPQVRLALLGLVCGPASLKHQSREIPVNQSGSLGLWLVCLYCLFVAIEPILNLDPLFAC